METSFSSLLDDEDELLEDEGSVIEEEIDESLLVRVPFRYALTVKLLPLSYVYAKMVALQFACTVQMLQIANLGLCAETMDALAARGMFSLFAVQAQVRTRIWGNPLECDLGFAEADRGKHYLVSR